MLSPAGARAITRRRLHCRRRTGVAVPRRGASCYDFVFAAMRSGWQRCCPPQGRELLLEERKMDVVEQEVAVPRRGASCYGKNAKNTMQIFGIPTIFLYYLLYFCVSIRDIVGFPRCEPACNNLIYCYYNTRFAPNQPVSKPSSIATGCKTQRHKL